MGVAPFEAGAHWMRSLHCGRDDSGFGRDDSAFGQDNRVFGQGDTAIGRETQPTQLLFLILMTLAKLGHWLFLKGRLINSLALSAVRILRSPEFNPHWRAMQT